MGTETKESSHRPTRLDYKPVRRRPTSRWKCAAIIWMGIEYHLSSTVARPRHDRGFLAIALGSANGRLRRKCRHISCPPRLCWWRDALQTNRRLPHSVLSAEGGNELRTTASVKDQPCASTCAKPTPLLGHDYAPLRLHQITRYCNYLNAACIVR
jgi:hypothetical protein